MRRAPLWWHWPLRSGYYKLSSRGVCVFLALATFIFLDSVLSPHILPCAEFTLVTALCLSSKASFCLICRVIPFFFFFSFFLLFFSR